MLRLAVIALFAAAASAQSCGTPQITPNPGRIVGGIEATPGSWPWQVALLTSSNFQFCGGSIISSQWILTAAHCCAGRTPASTRIRVGAHDLTSSTEGATTMTVSRIINHPQYSTRPATNNDFCLIKTTQPIAFGRKVSPVCLPSVSDSAEATGTTAYVTGWGSTGSGGSTVTRLRQARVRISNQQTCNISYLGVITPQMICAADTGKDSCQGDSGGPLVVNADGQYKLVGVTSWGLGCALPSHPGVYARTSTALNWISQTISQN